MRGVEEPSVDSWRQKSEKKKELRHMLFVLESVRSGDDQWIPVSLVTATILFHSEADKVSVEGVAVRDKEKSNESESGKEKKHGDHPSPPTANPPAQSAAVTQ